MTSKELLIRVLPPTFWRFFNGIPFEPPRANTKAATCCFCLSGFLCYLKNIFYRRWWTDIHWCRKDFRIQATIFNAFIYFVLQNFFYSLNMNKSKMCFFTIFGKCKCTAIRTINHGSLRLFLSYVQVTNHTFLIKIFQNEKNILEKRNNI